MVRRRVVKGTGPGGIVVSTRCRRLIDVLCAYRWDPKVREKDEPLHDWSSHLADALRYAVTGRLGRPTTKWSTAVRTY